MNEKYTFNFTTEEIKEIGKEVTNHKRDVCLQLLYVVIFILLLFLSILSRFVSDKLQGFFIGGLVVYILMLVYSYIQNKKIKKMGDERIANSTYQYEFFDDYILVTIKDKGTTRNINIKYADITDIKNCDTLYRMQYEGLYYFLRKKDLVENAKITTL